MHTHSRRWILTAVVYFVIGVGLGLAMGISGDHRLFGVHAHINLLGWVSMALMGLIYQFFPVAGGHGLARVQFWVYNIGLPPMMLGLGGKMLGHPSLEPLLAIGSLLVALGVLLFGINILKHRA